jgi:ABC-type uncharacterized transport system involved in gliding motility auxiliary subunit
MNEAQSKEGALAESSSLETVGLIAGVLGLTALIFGVVLYALDPNVVGLSFANGCFGVVTLAFYAITNWKSLSRTIAGRSTAFVLLEAAILAGLMGLVAAGNYLASKSPIEWDLTRDHLFTLTDQSIKLASKLQHPVRVIAFFRPSEAQRSATKDLVELYRKHTDKITFEAISPDSAPPALVHEYGMTATSPRIVIVGDNKQITKIKQPTEELLTNALLKVADRPPRKVYVLTGHGEPAIEDEKSEAGWKRAEILLHDEGYEVAPLSLIDKDQVPKDTTAIILASPQKALFPNEVEALDAWMLRGGRLFVLLEPGVEAGLAKLLDDFAVEVGDNLVLEPNPAARAQGFGPDAFVVQRFEPHPITDAMKGQAALFYWVRSVSPRLGATKVRTTTLIQTGPTSWGETKYRAGGEASRDEDDMPGPVPIAIASTMDTMTAPDRTSDQARLVVFGDASFANNRFASMGGNGDLFVNAVNWLVGDEEKITIRPKARGSSHLPLTDTQQFQIMFFSVNLLPLLIVGFGFSVWAVRRRK